MRRARDLFRMASEVVRDGCLAINKPCGMSSAQVIRECQVAFNPSNFFRPLIDAEVSKKKNDKNVRKRHLKKANQVKIGHGGTLDPLATGVLILGIGSGTKALPQFLDCVKTYETTVLFGASTDTYDRVGRVLTKRPYDHITRDKVEAALEAFRGKQMQMPPLYSALKMNGKPLYEYAREGKPIPREIESRQVEVKDLELVEWYAPRRHPHRWPTAQAEAPERNLAEQVWSIKKQQETGKKLTPEEKQEDDQAIAAHESFKREFEQRQDALITDSPSRRKHNRPGKEQPMMSGALGKMPEPTYSSRGQDLVPPSPDESTPPPWNDEGPPACRIRLTVTSGFYVRSFCHDLGAKLNSAALMSELVRTRQSDFTVGGVNCLEYEDLARGEAVWGPKVASMLAQWNGEPSPDWKPPSPPSTSGSTQQQAAESKRPMSPKQRIEADAAAIREKAMRAKGQKEYHRPFSSEKRRRSPSDEEEEDDDTRPARKTQARNPPGGGKSPSRDQDDDDKSWNGIVD